MSVDYIQITCPTRIDLAGGTLDLWPIYCLLGQAYTVNFAIDICTQVKLKKRANQMICLNIVDLKYRKTFSCLADVLKSDDQQIQLIKKVLKVFKPTFGFDLETSSMSPFGGGLGGSSSLLIGLLEAFEKVLEQSQNILSRVNMACNIESGFLEKPAGTQDYFAPALKKGLVLLNYDFKGVSYQHLKTPDRIKDKCVVIDTGRSHHSGWNNWQVLKDFINGDLSTKKALCKIAEVSKQMYQKCLDQDLTDLKDLFDEEFSARMSLNKAFSSPEITDLKSCLPEDSAMKICGAGGGGCVMVWTDDKPAIRDLCHQKGYSVLNAHPL